MTQKLRVFSVFAFALAMVGFSACDSKLEIVDGKIPAEFLPHAQSVVGSYVGQFQNQAMTLNTALGADQKLVLTPSADMAGPNCMSQVGQLKEIFYKEDSATKLVQITGATFAFNANQCAIEIIGTELKLDVTSDVGQPIQLDASILHHFELDGDCYNDPPLPNPPIPHPAGLLPSSASEASRGNCRRNFPIYLFGKFSKN